MIKATDCELPKAVRAEIDHEGAAYAAKGSANQARVNYALDDADAISAIEELFRDHLLAALSEAREKSVGIDGNIREKLMDDLSKHFHPDGQVRDLFTDGFYEARRMADKRVELVAAE